MRSSYKYNMRQSKKPKNWLLNKNLKNSEDWTNLDNRYSEVASSSTLQFRFIIDPTIDPAKMADIVIIILSFAFNFSPANLVLELKKSEVNSLS